MVRPEKNTAKARLDEKVLEQHIMKANQLGINKVMVFQESVIPETYYHFSDLFPVYEISRTEGKQKVTNHLTVSKLEQSKNMRKSYIATEPLPIKPHAPKSLQEVLRNIQKSNSIRTLTFFDREGREETWTYQEMLLEAERIFAGLVANGVVGGDYVIFQFIYNRSFISTLWACILGGFLPAPLGVVRDYTGWNNDVKKLNNIWNLLDHAVIVTDSELLPPLSKLSELWNVEEIKVLDIQTLSTYEANHNWNESMEDDLVLNIFTSGSTGVPKCVQHTNKSVLSMIHSSSTVLGITSEDIFLNWMPLDHVGGLILSHLQSTYYYCSQVHPQIEQFISRPLNWLDWMDRYQVSVTWGPNFAFALINSLEEELQAGSWNLQSVRHIINGAESIVPQTTQKYLNLLEPHALRESAITAAFGMSEFCSVITYSKSIIRGNLHSGTNTMTQESLTGALEFVDPDSPDAASMTELGAPLPGVSLRIVGRDNELLPECMIGRFQVKTDQLMKGYYRNQAANDEVMLDDGWFDTGDLAFLKEGILTITGRDKDVIIVNGKNYHNYEIESCVESVNGVSVTYAAACGIRDDANSVERLVIFFVPADDQFEYVLTVINKIQEEIVHKIGIMPEVIIPVAKQLFPKTNSGKIQRNELSNKYKAGHYSGIIQKIEKATGHANVIPHWFFQPEWKQQKLQEHSSDVASISRCYVLFADEHGLYKKIADNVILVEAGVSFEQVDANRYKLNPAKPEDYKELLQELALRQANITDIVHMWNYSEPASAAHTLATLRDSQVQGSHSLLLLIKGLSELMLSSVTVTVVTTNALLVNEDDRIAYDKSTMIGLVKTVEHEYSNMRCRVVDFDSILPELHGEAVKREIECAEAPALVAYRDGKRHIECLRQLIPEHVHEPKIPFVHAGMYVITGLGGIAKLVAAHLLNVYQAKLVIVGRTSLEELSANKKEIWSRLIEQSVRSGGQIEYRHAQIENEDEMSCIVRELEVKWKTQLRGIIHLAGIIREQLLTDMTVDSLEEHYTAKLYGTYVLHQIALERADCLFVAASSARTMTSGMTVGGYCSANSFVEAFVQHQRLCGIQAVCLSWSFWDEVGMSQGLIAKEAMIAKGYSAISAKRGLESLLTGVSVRQPVLYVGLDGTHHDIRARTVNPSPLQLNIHVLLQTKDGRGVFPTRLSEVIADYLQGIGQSGDFRLVVDEVRTWPELPGGESETEALMAHLASRLTRHRFVAPQTELEHELAGMWKELLHADRVGLTDSFFALGGHSLIATQLVSRLRERFGVPISLQDLFVNPTVSQLAECIQGMQEQSVMPTIQARPRPARIPMSNAQKRQWFIYQWEPDNVYYLNTFTLRITGRLDVEMLRQSIQSVVDRHETLRTSFSELDGELVQIVHPSCRLDIPLFDIRHEPDIEVEARRRSKLEATNPIHLAQDPLIRAQLLRTSEFGHQLLITIHHIVSDGWSIGVFLRELNELYTALSQGTAPNLAPLSIQYVDFSLWQEEWLDSRECHDQLSYWKQQLDGAPQMMELPTDFARPINQTFHGRRKYWTLNKPLSDGIRMLTRKHEATLFMTLISAFSTLLYRYSGQNDLVIGTAIANRNRVEVEQVIGMFVNTLALRFSFSNNLTFGDHLQQVKQMMLDAYEHQDIPFEVLLNELKVDRDPSTPPLVQVMFIVQNENLHITGLHDLDIAFQIEENDSSYFDIIVHVFEQQNGELTIQLDYNEDLYRDSTIEAMLKHYEALLERMTGNDRQRLNALPLLSEKELVQLESFHESATVRPYKASSLHEWFEQQVLRSPDRYACSDETERLSYKELNERANQLARSLRSMGVSRNRLVILLHERSVSMLVGMLGILKAGGAFLPIDPELPPERVAYLIEDSGAEFMVTRKELGLSRSFTGNMLLLDDASVYEGSSDNLEVDSGENDLLYVIYTSGTTGKPKGVQLEHRTLLNLLAYQQAHTDLVFDRVLQFTTLSFDVCYQEIFSTLLSGGELYMIDDERKRDVQQLAAFVNRHRIQTMFLPTSFLKLLASDPAYFEPLAGQVRQIVTAGEQLVLSNTMCEMLRQYQIKLYNHYGPSETHVVTIHEVNAEQSKELPPIGKPISDTEILILNDAGLYQPIGVIGEMYIAGISLARGYHNRPELTDEKFIAHPYRRNQLMYRTGDLARWLSDGSIEYVGRRDHQVKIRGHRVELGEIEAQLREHGAVKDAVVLVRGEGEHKYLSAYVVFAGVVNAVELRTQLANVLPDYMIPSRFIPLNAIPLTANGKVNRTALTEQEGFVTLETEHISPRNETEARLIEIWQELLGIETIGISSNFFALGGHSLNATLLLTRVRKAFGVEYALREFFAGPTIKEQAERIRQAGGKGQALIPQIAASDYYEASSAQKRLYAITQYEGASTSYNMPSLFKIEGALNEDRLRNAVQRIVDRHEVLRTTFVIQDGELKQCIHQNAVITIEKELIEKEQVSSYVRALIRPFDLSEAPLLRVGLLECEDRTQLLWIDRHHMVFDGLSMNVFMQELIDNYDEGAAPDALPVQYKDFVAWTNGRMQESLAKDESYWSERLSGELPVLQLPVDYPRPLTRSFEGARQPFSVHGELTGILRKLAEREGATLYMVLLAAFNILLAKYSGQEDVIVGSPIADRPHTDLEQLIGMFVNTLPMRNAPSADKSFVSFLAEVKHHTLAAFEHQNYPLESLVSNLAIERDVSRNPLFDAMLVFQNLASSKWASKDAAFAAYPLDFSAAKFDLTFDVMEQAEELYFEIEYSIRLFAPETIERMGRHYIQLLESLANRPDCLIGELDMVTEKEKQQLLTDFCGVPNKYSVKTLHELFVERAMAYPDRVAIEFGTRCMTYGELDAKSNALAHKLRESGIGSDQIVAIMVERSFEMIIFIIAVLKTGAAYLPVDPGFPAERISFILSDSGARMLLVKDRPAMGISAQVPVLAVHESELTAVCSDSFAAHPSSQAAAAYVMYTSGSTGNPKGVIVRHSGVVNLLTYLEQCYPLQESDAFLLKTTYTFDVSVTEIFGFFFGHGRLVILEQGAEKDPQRIMEVIKRCRITHINFVPSMLSIFPFESEQIRMMETLDYVFVAGEAMPMDLVRRFRGALPGVSLENLYGPTEATIYATGCSLDASCQHHVSIGRPVANTQTYIISPSGQLQPIGLPGELCIGGDGVAIGYLNYPELTARKFVANPYTNDGLLYSTGDLARWSADGTIEYLGRMDHQVKIRGYRIELDEIRQRLIELETVEDAVVVARSTDNGQSYLCAYYIAKQQWTVKELRRKLLEYLPDYMVPAFFISMEQFPQTSSGKIDRKQLPDPEGSVDTGEDYVEPRSELERLLCDCWEKILLLDNVGVLDDFFALGGDSIKAIQIASKFNGNERGWRLAVGDVLTHRTIERIAYHVKTNQEHVGYEQGLIAGDKQLTPIEHWFFARKLTEPHYFNQSIMLEWRKEFNIVRLEAAFEQLIAHHDGLRLNADLRARSLFFNNNHLHVPFKIAYYDLSGQGDSAQLAVEEATQVIKSSFNIELDLLIKVAAFDMGQSERRLLITAHHLLTDGITWRILLEDLAYVYGELEMGRKPSLPDKTASLLDWQAYVEGVSVAGTHREERAYWEEALLQPFSLPLDAETDEWIIAKQQTIRGALDPARTLLLRGESNRAFNTEITDLLLTALACAVHQWTSVTDLVVMLENHGRYTEALDVSRTTGWFTTMYPMRLQLIGETLSERIKGIKQQTRMLPHDGIGFGILQYLDKALPEDNGNLTELRFNYLGQFDQEFNNGLFGFTNMSAVGEIGAGNPMSAKVDVNCMIVEGIFSYEIAYHGTAMREETMLVFAESFMNHLEQIIEYTMSQEEVEFTPSDFEQADLDQNALDLLFQ